MELYSTTSTRAHELFPLHSEALLPSKRTPRFNTAYVESRRPIRRTSLLSIACPLGTTSLICRVICTYHEVKPLRHLIQTLIPALTAPTFRAKKALRFSQLRDLLPLNGTRGYGVSMDTTPWRDVLRRCRRNRCWRDVTASECL